MNFTLRQSYPTPKKSEHIKIACMFTSRKHSYIKGFEFNLINTVNLSKKKSNVIGFLNVPL